MKMAGDKLHTWRSLDSTSKECGGCVKISKMQGAKDETGSSLLM